jgi:hypothetical protein
MVSAQDFCHRYPHSHRSLRCQSWSLEPTLTHAGVHRMLASESYWVLSQTEKERLRELRLSIGVVLLDLEGVGTDRLSERHSEIT